MWSRCTSPSARERYCYGVKVHEEWRDFAVFLRDVGERIDGTTLDRIDRTKPYGPGNVRWATNATQSRNRSCVKLSESDVVEIRRRIAAGERQRSVAAEFGVSESLVCMIKKGARWRDA